MIALIAALPREVARLVRGVPADREGRAAGVYLYRVSPRVTIACAGMGSERVLLAARAAESCGRLTKLVSVGLAGGCDPSVPVGTVLHAREVIDAGSGERRAAMAAAGAQQGTLVTAHAIASVREKERLFATYGAAMVDMEAATLGRRAEMLGVEFGAIKAISDAHDFELSALSRFASPRGHFRTGAFALHTAVRPHRWGAAMQLGAGSQRALLALTETLKEWIDG